VLWFVALESNVEIMEKFNILVEIGHPAHVHFFKNPISIWKKNGHSVHVVTRDKEITHTLLNEIGIPYTALSKQQANFFLMILELLVRWTKIYFLIKKHKVNTAISISGISTSFPAFVSRIVSITNTDTEDASLSNSIAFRFSDIVLTPSTFLKKDRYKNLKTYESFHELAYLHPHWFKPDTKNLNSFNIQKGDQYVFIRLVKWKALHDINEKGISEDNLRRIIHVVQDRGYKVFISTERKIASGFDPFIIKGELSKIFDVMAFSYGFIGESPTMAVETALLGRPSVLINSRVNHLGNMVELQNKYHLLQNFENFNAALPFIEGTFFTPESCDKIAAARRRLLRDKIDIAAWIARFTVDYTQKYYEGKKS
jgi:uncharacterized protein